MGTPERPLSDLGLKSYRSYWTRVLLNAIKKHKSNISIKVSILLHFSEVKFSKKNYCLSFFVELILKEIV